MKKLSECLFVFAIGAILYYAIEIIYRGYSHWSMFLLGGCGMLFIDIQGHACRWQEGLVIQVFRSSIFILCLEFMTGLIVNKWLSWQIWDYSDQPYTLWGQICLPFSLAFAGLSLLGILLCGSLSHLIYAGEKPGYRLF